MLYRPRWRLIEAPGDMPRFRSSSNRQKQDIYDAFPCTSLIIGVMYGDEQSRAGAKEIARDVLKMLGFAV